MTRAALTVAFLIVALPSYAQADSPVFGVRVGSMAPFGELTGGNGYSTPATQVLSSGWALEALVGAQLGAGWTLYGFYEHGLLGESGYGAPNRPTTRAFGAGADVMIPARGPIALLIDCGFGLRFATAQVPERTAGLPLRWREQDPGSFTPFRAGVGVAFTPWKYVRLDLLVRADYNVAIGGECPDGCVGSFGFYGLALGARAMP